MRQAFVHMTKPRFGYRTPRSVRYRHALHGKTILITGGSRGIGAATALMAGRAGARVLVAARSSEALEAVAAEIRQFGGESQAYATDLSRLEDVDVLADAVLRDHGGVDIVVHNAGRSIRRPTRRSLDRFHDYERTMRLNYFSPVRLTLRFLPSLTERNGTVSLVLTMGVFARVPNFSAYVASKCALDAFGDVLVSEHHHELKVSSVYPPLVRTEMASATKEFAERTDAMTPDAAAQMILDGIVDDRRRVVTPRGRVYAFTRMALPMTTVRFLNHLARTYPVGDEPSEFPAHKALIDRWGRGTPF